MDDLLKQVVLHKVSIDVCYHWYGVSKCLIHGSKHEKVTWDKEGKKRKNVKNKPLHFIKTLN